MPLFGIRRSKRDTENVLNDNVGDSANHVNGNNSKPKLVFHCQQAQGSPTGIITGFTNIKELYQKIAECYDFPVSEVLFCTLNSHKADMSKLLGGQIGLDDFIFVHRKGQPKEVEVKKADDSLGLTITDNGSGYAFIKRIKEGSLMDRIGFVHVGDHIEKINDRSMVGCRHFEVAKALKEIRKGDTFVLRLIEPLKAGFSHIGPRNGVGGNNAKRSGFGSGRETLRLRAKGPATVEQAPDHVIQAVVERINSCLESFMGINDSELATQIWELGCNKNNPTEFIAAVEGSDLEAFRFTEDFLLDIWGAITDARAGRLKLGLSPIIPTPNISSQSQPTSLIPIRNGHGPTSLYAKIDKGLLPMLIAVFIVFALNHDNPLMPKLPSIFILFSGPMFGIFIYTETNIISATSTQDPAATHDEDDDLPMFARNRGKTTKPTDRPTLPKDPLHLQFSTQNLQ